MFVCSVITTYNGGGLVFSRSYDLYGVWYGTILLENPPTQHETGVIECVCMPLTTKAYYPTVVETLLTSTYNAPTSALLVSS